MQVVEDVQDLTERRPAALPVLDSLLLISAMWGNVIDYLRERELYTPFDNPYAERRAARTVLKSDAYLIGLLVMRKRLLGERSMTVRQLARALATDDEPSQKSMARKIKRIAAEAAHFGLFRGIDDTHEVTGQRVIRIEGLPNLPRFFDDEVLRRLPAWQLMAVKR